MVVDWSMLPSDLVRLIAGKLFIEDFAALSSLCKSYRCAVDKNLWRPNEGLRPPWLLLCCQDNGSSEGDSSPINERGFLNMYKHNLKSYMHLPEIYGRRCWGSPYGWIVTVGLDRQLHLFNPLNRRRILLPPPDLNGMVGEGDKESVWMRKMFINRAILIKRKSPPSAPAACDDFFVITMGHLGDLRVLRHYTWETLKFSFIGPRSSGITKPGRIDDVICYNGQVYALGVRGGLFLCSNLDGPDPLTAQQFVLRDHKEEIFQGDEKSYLVDYFGDLLMVVRYYEWLDNCKPHYKTLGFLTYKLNKDTNQWIEVEDLGDWALFVGDCQSIPLPQSETMNCRRNCIYFTDDYYEQITSIGGKDMGIYHFDTQSIEPLYDGADSLSTYSTPTWLIPSFT